MQAILAVTVPFFALVLAGYVAAWRRLLPERSATGVHAFVLWFALPCTLLRIGMDTPLDELLNPALIAVYAVSALTVVFFSIALTLSRRVPLKDAALGAMAAAQPNTGFMGVALLAALLGPRAAGPAVCAVLVDIFFTAALCQAVAQRYEAGSSRAAVALALRRAVAHPLPWALAAGVALALLELPLAGVPATMVQMLAAATAPAGLFAVGALVWHAAEQTRRQPRRQRPLAEVLIKLLLHPLLVFLLGASSRQLGAPLSALQVGALTLAAALPSVSHVALLAEQLQADTARVGRILVATTVVAFATLTLLALGFGVRPAL